MQESQFPFPDLEILTAALSIVFRNFGFTDSHVAILDRRSGIYDFPHEVVTCRFNDSNELRVLCKFGSRQSLSTHRGVSYEGEVYRHVLQQLRVSVPAFYGTYIEPTGTPWLVLEYLDQCL